MSHLDAFAGEHPVLAVLMLWAIADSVERAGRAVYVRLAS